MNKKFRKLGYHWRRWLGVFIASNHFLAVGWLCWRWAHRTVRWRTGQVLFTVRCAPRQHARWSLERLDRWSRCTGQSGATPDMSGDLWLRCSDFCRALFITVHFCSRPLTRSDRCSAGSLDMSSAHWTVWWIIAKRVQRIPESGMFACARACCPVHTGQYPVRHRQHTLKSFALNLFVSPNWISFLVCVEPYAYEINDILAN
jgi:hypothetical protein